MAAPVDPSDDAPPPADDASSRTAGQPNWTDDDVLVPALLSGDDAAFAWLLDTYSAPLRRLARQHVATDAHADEVVQETWLAVITGLPRFERRSSLRTWLYRVLLNVARSKGVREHRSLPFSSVGDPGAADEPILAPDRFRGAGDEWPGWWAIEPESWAPRPELQVGRNETLGVVAAALETLPPNQREVITLRDVLGWSAAEVCQALDVTDVHQRVLLHRARARVRAAVEAHLESVA